MGTETKQEKSDAVCVECPSSEMGQGGKGTQSKRQPGSPSYTSLRGHRHWIMAEGKLRVDTSYQLQIAIGASLAMSIRRRDSPDPFRMRRMARLQLVWKMEKAR